MLMEIFKTKLRAKLGIFGKPPKPSTPEFEGLFRAWCYDMGLVHEDKKQEFNSEYE